MKKIGVLLILICFITVNFSSFAIAADNNLQIEKEEKISLAEITLEKVAQRGRSQRKAAGKISIGLGTGFIILGASTGEEEVLLGTGVAGGILIGTGLLSLAIPTEAEKEYDQVKSSPPTQRQESARESLAYLSSKAKQGRIMSGILNSGLAVYWLSQTDESNQDSELNLYTGILYAGTAIYQFINPTYVEKSYQKIKNEEMKVSVTTGSYFGPTLSYNF